MKTPNSFTRQVIAPTLTGFAVGLTSMFGFDSFVSKNLDHWLHDNPTGTFMLGLYLVILGMVGIASFLIDTENLKNRVRMIPIVKWYSKVAGLLSGLTISAIVFGSITEIALLGFCAVLLFAITWLFWILERVIFTDAPNEPQKKLASGVASIASVLLGIFAFYLAWKDFHGGQL